MKMKRILCQYASAKRNANRNSLGEREKKISLKETWNFTGAAVWILTPKASCSVAWHPGWPYLDRVEPWETGISLSVIRDALGEDYGTPIPSYLARGTNSFALSCVPIHRSPNNSVTQA